MYLYLTRTKEYGTWTHEYALEAHREFCYIFIWHRRLFERFPLARQYICCTLLFLVNVCHFYVCSICIKTTSLSPKIICTSCLKLPEICASSRAMLCLTLKSCIILFSWFIFSLHATFEDQALRIRYLTMLLNSVNSRIRCNTTL